jgi:hypothetical protein
MSDLGASNAHVEVQIVEKIDRVGSGAKQKLVVST